MRAAFPAARAAPAALLLAALVASACAAPGAAAPGPVLELPPEDVEVRRSDLDLAGKNEEELLAIARAAAQVGDAPRAAAAYGRLADSHPASPRRAEALLGAGRAHEQLSQWRRALGRFRELAAGGPGPDADRAALEAAACHREIGERAEARAILARLAARADLAPPLRLRALVERGVVELEAGDSAEAERSLEQALAEWARDAEGERVDERIPARAHYWLGEVYRTRFEAAPLDLAAPEEELLPALEEKSRLLLAAQGHYLQAARRGSPDTGVAGVARVGELYEGLHARMLAAPPPPGLAGPEAEAWRAELRRQLRVLARKALEAYEVAVESARALGVDGGLAEDAERSLERVKRLLLEEPP